MGTVGGADKERSGTSRKGLQAGKDEGPHGETESSQPAGSGPYPAAAGHLEGRDDQIWAVEREFIVCILFYNKPEFKKKKKVGKSEGSKGMRPQESQRCREKQDKAEIGKHEQRLKKASNFSRNRNFLFLIGSHL